MRYTVHVGPRNEAWPPVADAAPVREEARRVASRLLAAAPADPPHKAEVRDRGVRLLDCFGRRGGTRVFHTYSAPQPVAAPRTARGGQPSPSTPASCNASAPSLA